MNVLIIEDDKLKHSQISTFLAENYPIIHLTWKESYQSGLKALETTKYNLVLLDMSMHIYEKSTGSFEKYAGQMILREIDMWNIDTKVIVVTMFDTFADGKTLEELKQELRNESSDYYIDTVYYNASETKWRNELKELIDFNFFQ